MMESESDIFEGIETVTNFYPQASRILKSFKWSFEDPSSYIKHDHQPIVMNQCLLIVGDKLKTYTLKHRYFQIASDLVLTQSQIAQLNPSFSYMPHHDLTPIFTKTIKAFARTARKPNNF